MVPRYGAEVSGFTIENVPSALSSTLVIVLWDLWYLSARFKLSSITESNASFAF